MQASFGSMGFRPSGPQPDWMRVEIRHAIHAVSAMGWVSAWAWWVPNGFGGEGPLADARGSEAVWNQRAVSEPRPSGSVLGLNSRETPKTVKHPAWWRGFPRVRASVYNGRILELWPSIRWDSA